MGYNKKQGFDCQRLGFAKSLGALALWLMAIYFLGSRLTFFADSIIIRVGQFCRKAGALKRKCVAEKMPAQEGEFDGNSKETIADTGKGVSVTLEADTAWEDFGGLYLLGAVSDKAN